MLKTQYIQALTSFNTNRKVYLEVVGKGTNQHLAAVSKNWWGRFWMHLGFGSAHLTRVAKYIQKMEFSELNSKMKEDTQFKKSIYSLEWKFLKYCGKRIEPTLYKGMEDMTKGIQDLDANLDTGFNSLTNGFRGLSQGFSNVLQGKAKFKPHVKIVAESLSRLVTSHIFSMNPFSLF